MFVFIHHAQHTHGCVISATISLQQLVVLCTDLLPHLTCGFDQLVLHQGGKVIVGLEMSLAVGRQAHQAGLLGLLPPCCAEVTQDLPGLGLGPGLAPTVGATRFLQDAASVQIQSAGVRHSSYQKSQNVDSKSTGELAQQQICYPLGKMD